jgi:AcrR family transcriptional regulator
MGMSGRRKEPGLATEQPLGTRLHILAAAEEIIHDRGLRACTTRAIAERAGCAEGSIYRYFEDKHALFMEIVRTRFPEFLELVSTLPDRAGTSTVRRNLEEVAWTALGFYRIILPLVVGAMGERELLEEQRRHFHETKGGPMKSLGAVAAYLRKEQRLGRISQRISPDYAARSVLGACFSQVLLEELVGDDARLGEDRQYAREIVRNLMEGLTPPRSTVASLGGDKEMAGGESR